ncbi:hypothetical protein D3C71_72530 [compost metagenome]
MNNIKKVAIALSAYLLSNMYTPVNAQIQIGSSITSAGPGKISKEEMVKFKQSTTYFILQERDYERLEDFQTAIAKVWTVTPFKIIKQEEMRSLDKRKSSFFFFGGFVTIRRGQSTTTYNTHLSYDLYMLEANKKGNLEQQLFGKFMLHLDSESYKQTMRFATSDKTFAQKITPYMYSEAEMQNWNPLMISGYLKVINDGLQQETLRSAFGESIDKEALKKLQTETLYIPDYVNTKFNMFNMDEKDTEEDMDDLKSAYPFPAKYVSTAALSTIAAQHPEGIWYLSYIKSSTDKYVGIFNSKTGEMIMNFYVPVSYNFKMKDLKRVAAKVKS